MYYKELCLFMEAANYERACEFPGLAFINFLIILTKPKL